MRSYRDPAVPIIQPAALTRRRFVQGLALGGMAAATGLWRSTAQAGQQAVLTGPGFDLTIDTLPVNFTGRPRLATVINGSLPGPLLRWREGDTVTLRVTNRLAETTSIHWHGIILPAAMDGVPGMSFNGIAPGETFVYRFPVVQSGTYWYHSHSGHQEQTGLYAPLVIEPRGGEATQAMREHVVMLSDWTDEDPQRVLARLKKQSDYYNFNQRTVGDFLSQARREGLGAAFADSRAWGAMRMNPADLSDVSGATYTYLMNGTAPAANWTGLFQPGERVRLRFINAAAMTFFDVRIPGLRMTVVTADGQPVHPVTVEEFRISPAETFDVIVTPADEPYTIFAQSADRTGFARGTLAPRAGLVAAVPKPDAPVLLTMADMGHGDHAAHGAPAAAMQEPRPEPAPAAGHEGHAMPADEHAGHAMPAAAGVLPQGITHTPAEFGPMVDMRTMTPSPRLDDPGVGLRDNGRRVLTYADLHSAFPDPDGRDPGRTIELHLTGHMDRYTWSFNGVHYRDAKPLRLAYGERVRFVLVNDGMMEHPIHLHGMWSDLEDEQGRFQVRKHTISVKPGHMLSYRVRADALGRWAYHCHLMLHMGNGMFREVVVDEESRHG